MARARSDYDLAATLAGGGMWRDTGTSAGAQSGAARVLKGEALADSTGQAGARTVSVHLDQDAEGTSRTFACDCPVSSGDRVTVVLQGGAYKVVSAASMDREQQAQREEIDEQAKLVEEVTAKVESARQQAEDAQQAAEEAGGRADDALEAAQQAAGDAQAGVAEAKQAAEEASGRAEELAGQVSEVRTEVEGLSTAVSGAVDTAEGALSMATEVGQSLESYKVEASQTYLDKQTGETLATKAELEAKADEITLAVSEEYQPKGDYATADDLAGMSVGGRNYVKSADVDKTLNGITVECTGVDWRVHGTNTKTDAAYDHSSWTDDWNLSLVPGETYTLSTTEPIPAGLYLQVNSVSTGGGQMYVGQLWGDGVKTSTTFTVPEDSDGSGRGFFGVNRTCGTIDATFRIKLEKGTIPTDWTPAPEDAEERYATKAELTVTEDAITAQVSEVATTADAAMSKATEVEQTAEGLSAEISQVSQTADGAVTQLATLTATVEGISSEVSVAQETADSAVEAASQAQQDITGFKQTVSQTYQTKADAGSAMEQERLDRQSAIEQSAAQIRQEVGQSYQPKGDYATTAQVSSAIDQRADEITLAVSQSYQPKGDYLTSSDAASAYASKAELTAAEASITARVEEVASDASGAYSLASSVQQTAEGLEVEITAAQESAEEAAKTATSFLRVTQSGVQLARESGGNDPQINLNVSGAASYVDVTGIPSGAGGYRHARIDGSSLTLGTSGGAHSIEIDAESQTITAQSLQVDADIITLHSPAATLQASEHYGGLMVQAGGLTGLLADWVTSHGGTANDWEWRKWASGKWEAWAIYGNLSCKPNGTTDVTCKIPSAIGNTANNYVVLATFTRQGNTSAADGWSKLAWVVLSQTASSFVVRIWGDNTFASPYIPMSLSVLVLGRP